ncbi:hypothetical protein ACFSKM_07110 [Ancylobacter dichloromethanicus]
MSPASPLVATASPLLVPLQLEALVIEGEASPQTGELLLARHTAERGAALRWKGRAPATSPACAPS